MANIREGDEVKILSGFDAGLIGKVKTVIRKDRKPVKVVVEGVNLVLKHVRPSQRNQAGGRLSKEMPVDISNVMLVCPACGRPSRTGVRYLDDGSKERYCKACGAGNGQLAPPRARYAKQSS